MRKLTKKALSLVLSLLLVISAISGALSISAETVVNDAPLNLDFSDGFNHWKNTSNVAVDKGTVTFTEGRGPWIYLQTEDFKIPNLQEGDKVAFSRIVTVINPELAATAKYTNIFRTNFMTSADSWANHFVEYQASINTVDAATGEITKPGTGLFTNATSGAISTSSFTVTDPEQSFRIQIAMGNGPVGSVSIANMKIVVTKANGISYIYTNGTTPFEGYYDGNVAGGTEADGYTTTSAGAVLKYPTLSAPTNLDFKEGLKYWAPYREKNTTATSTSTYASVDNGILTLKRLNDETYKQGITSQKFTVSNVAVGDKIRFIFEYDFDDENGKIRDFNFRVNRYTTDAPQTSLHVADLGCINNKNYFEKAPGEMSDTGWRTYFADHIVVDANDAYAMSLFYYCGTKIADGADTATKFRNLRVVKVLSDGAYLDLATNEKISADFQPFGGTEEDGIVNKPYKGEYRVNSDKSTGVASGDKRIKELFGTNTNLVNGDFSQGFKYWFGGSYKAAAPTALGLGDYATVENGIVKFSVVENYTPLLFTLPFYIENLKANDILVAAVDVRNAPTKTGSTGIQVNLGELKDHSSSFEFYSTQSEKHGDFFAAPSETEWTTIWGKELTVTDPAHPFFIRIGKAAEDAAEFKNVRIYKIDAATGEITIVNNGYNADNNFNKDGGSAENGLLELGNFVQSIPATEKLTNLDFSQGLKYWAPMRGANGFASDFAKVEEDGSLTLFKSGVQTAPIKFADKFVGKKAALYYYGNFSGSVYEMSYYENGTRKGAYARGYSGLFEITIPEIVKDATYTFEIKLPAGGEVNLENFKLVIFEANEIGADSCFDLDGNEFMGPGLNFQPIGGTEENGIISYDGIGLPSSSYWHLTSTQMPANDGLMNADFSEGFKYWVYKIKGEILSDNLALDKETGVVSYKESDNTLWSGLYSQVFTLKNSGIKKDDVLYAAVDVTNTPSNMSVNLHSHYQNADGTWNHDTKNGGGSGPISAERWATIYSGAMTVEDLNTLFYVDIQKGHEEGQGSFKNVRMLRKDRGNLKETVVNGDMTETKEVLVRVNVDGSLLDTQVYGDANYDGKIDLLDLVRMKKFAAGDPDGNGIFLAAVDADKDDVVEADDFSAVVAWLFEAKK